MGYNCVIKIMLSLSLYQVLRDYVKFAKDRYNPVLSDEAGQKMISYYVEMRKVFTFSEVGCPLFWSFSIAILDTKQ